MEKVILVDDQDSEIGTEEKLTAHRLGLLHRAFSVFVFNDQGHLLLQQRASTKYHSPLLWTNTCCSHPKPNESTIDAAKRRCKEEMGIEPTITPAFSFVYKAELDQGLIEHEYDHVFIGSWNADPVINNEEVADYKWIALEELKADVDLHPQQYTVWFKICLDRVIEYYNNHVH